MRGIDGQMVDTSVNVLQRNLAFQGQGRVGPHGRRFRPASSHGEQGEQGREKAVSSGHDARQTTDGGDPNVGAGLFNPSSRR